MKRAPSHPTRNCSLGPDALASRLVWIADLNSRWLIASRRTGLELVLEYSPLAIDEVEKLIEHEQACCSFLSFRLDKTANTVKLTITAQEAARDTAEALFERFSTARSAPAPSTCCGARGCT